MQPSQYVRPIDEWEKLCDRAFSGYMPSHVINKDFYAHARNFIQGKIKPLNLWSPGDVVLDIGCGNGRAAMGLIGEEIEYYGFDVVKPCIDWCKEIFAPWNNYHFYHVDVKNTWYWSKGNLSAHEVRFPFREESFDTVLAFSIFTHLGNLRNAIHYVNEIDRVSRSGANFLLTFFRSPPNEVSAKDSRTVYLEEDILDMLQRFDLIKQFEGTTKSHHDQWYIQLRKK